MDIELQPFSSGTFCLRPPTKNSAMLQAVTSCSRMLQPMPADTVRGSFSPPAAQAPVSRLDKDGVSGYSSASSSPSSFYSSGSEYYESLVWKRRRSQTKPGSSRSSRPGPPASAAVIDAVAPHTDLVASAPTTPRHLTGRPSCSSCGSAKKLNSLPRLGNSLSSNPEKYRNLKRYIPWSLNEVIEVVKSVPQQLDLSRVKVAVLQSAAYRLQFALQRAVDLTLSLFGCLNVNYFRRVCLFLLPTSSSANAPTAVIDQLDQRFDDDLASPIVFRYDNLQNGLKFSLAKLYRALLLIVDSTTYVPLSCARTAGQFIERLIEQLIGDIDLSHDAGVMDMECFERVIRNPKWSQLLCAERRVDAVKGEAFLQLLLANAAWAGLEQTHVLAYYSEQRHFNDSFDSMTRRACQFLAEEPTELRLTALQLHCPTSHWHMCETSSMANECNAAGSICAAQLLLELSTRDQLIGPLLDLCAFPADVLVAGLQRALCADSAHALVALSRAVALDPDRLAALAFDAALAGSTKCLRLLIECLGSELRAGRPSQQNEEDLTSNEHIYCSVGDVVDATALNSGVAESRLSSTDGLAGHFMPQLGLWSLASCSQQAVLQKTMQVTCHRSAEVDSFLFLCQSTDIPWQLTNWCQVFSASSESARCRLLQLLLASWDIRVESRYLRQRLLVTVLPQIIAYLSANGRSRRLAAKLLSLLFTDRDPILPIRPLFLDGRSSEGNLTVKNQTTQTSQRLRRSEKSVRVVCRLANKTDVVEHLVKADRLHVLLEQFPCLSTGTAGHPDTVYLSLPNVSISVLAVIVEHLNNGCLSLDTEKRLGNSLTKIKDVLCCICHTLRASMAQLVRDLERLLALQLCTGNAAEIFAIASRFSLDELSTYTEQFLIKVLSEFVDQPGDDRKAFSTAVSRIQEVLLQKCDVLRQQNTKIVSCPPSPNHTNRQKLNKPNYLETGLFTVEPALL